jgi:hypothetical protein
MHDVAVTIAPLLHDHRVGAAGHWCACENSSNGAMSEFIWPRAGRLPADDG